MFPKMLEGLLSNVGYRKDRLKQESTYSTMSWPQVSWNLEIGNDFHAEPSSREG